MGGGQHLEGEEERQRNVDGSGERWGKHSPGHIKDEKRKENKQKNMSDTKTLVSVATDNGCLWPSEA